MLLFFFIQFGCKEQSIDIVTDRVITFQNKYSNYFHNYSIVGIRYDLNSDEFVVRRYDGISDFAVISTDRNKMIVKNFYYSEPIDELFVNNFINTGAIGINVTDEFIRIWYMMRDSIYIVYGRNDATTDWPEHLVPYDSMNYLCNNWRYMAYPVKRSND